MKIYEKYKDSGAEWIGEIPESWKTVKIKFITDIYTGNSLNSDLKILFESENENDLPYVSTKDIDIDNNTLNYNNGLRIPLDNSYYKVAPEGSFLLCIEGANAGKKMAYVEQDCCFVNKLACFNFPNKFLFYFAQSNSFKTQFFNSISGLIGGVSISVLKEFVSTIPSPKEQTQIAAYLDHKTDLIDAIIAQKEALIIKLKEQRQAIINEAVTKGLNPDVKLKDSGIKWLGDIPEHWEVIKLRYLADITTGGKDTENREDEGVYPFFVRSQTVERISTYSFDGEAILTAGDGVGVCKVWHYINGRFDYHQRVYMMHNFRKVTGVYLFNFMKENFINEVLKLSAKSTVDSLRRPMFLEFPVAVPPLEEQSSIIDMLINKQKLIDHSIKGILSSIQKLKEYRQSLISEAVTGKIDVRDWQAPKS